MMNWLSLVPYVLITAFTPGPNNIMSMSNGNAQGFRKSIPFSFGVWIGFSMVAILCTIFCKALSELIPSVMLPMQILGAGYMVYLAWKIYHSSGNIEEQSKSRGLLSAILLQFVNPKGYIYAIVSMELYILPHYGISRIVMRCSSPLCLRLWVLFPHFAGPPSRGRFSSGCSPATTRASVS